MMFESIQKSLFEGLASIGDISLFHLLELTGDLGNNVLLLLLQLLGEKNLKDLQNDTINAYSVQEKLLLSILDLQKDTVYGRRYNFAAIKTVSEFRSIHPLTTYENYCSTIDNIANTGNFNLLAAEPINLFQETSGTTGKIKLIPRTERLSWSFLKASQATEVVVKSFYQNTNPCLQTQIGLALVHTLPVKLTPSGIPQGTGTSGGFRQAVGKFKLVNKLISLKFSSPASVFLIPEYESAYYCHFLFSLQEINLTFIAANFASNVLEAIQILEKRWQQILDDIASGSISKEIEIDEKVRNELQALLKPNPNRAEVLKVEFEKGFDGILSRLWTQLSYIQCITTGSMSLYEEKLKFYAGKIPFYSGSYGASEAWIGVNLTPQKYPPAYVVTPHSAYFEFIPEAEIDVETPSTMELTSLKIGENYEVVVTTVAGLYRYRLGDIIKCVGYYNQSPVVEFLYRKGTLLNIAGEKVNESTIFTALTKAIKVLSNNCQVIDYTTRIELSSQPWRYFLYVEVSETFEISPNLITFKDKVEQVISELNESYKELRELSRIGQIEIKLLHKNSFQALKTKIIAQGCSEAQFKMPRLLTNLDLVNFIEEMVIS